MNILDLIIVIVLALALWNGWRRGLVLQLFSLVSIVAAIWLAAHYGGEAGAFLKLDEAYREPAGFVVVLLGGLLLVALLARLVRKLFQFAGFGWLDRLGGVLVAAAKYLLLLSLAFAAFERINGEGTLLAKEKIEQSKGYAPVRDLSRRILPFVSWLGEEVNHLKKEI